MTNEEEYRVVAIPDNIPDLLAERRQWDNWTYAKDNGAKRAVCLPRTGTFRHYNYKNGGHDYLTLDEARRYIGDPESWDRYDDVEYELDFDSLEGSQFSDGDQHKSKTGEYGLFYHLPDPDKEGIPDKQITFIDLDDVRDPDTGERHPKAEDIIERADSYAQVSTSGTGDHVFVIGPLPDGVETIDHQLPDHPDFPDAEIEVYDKDRPISMTGDQIPGTPDEVNENQELIDELVDEFVSDSEPEASPDDIDFETDPELDKEEVVGDYTTTSRQDQFDAVSYLTPRDIRLRSDITEERSDGSLSIDPSWTNSKSGSRVAYLGDGVFTNRNGMKSGGIAHMVAREEGIINSLDESLSGKWDEVVEALRERGAEIPEYDPTYNYFSNAAILPELRDESAPSSISQDDLREMVGDKIRAAMINGDQVVIDAIMSAGKSYGVFKQAQKLEQQITYLCPRNEHKEEMRQYALENGFVEDDIKMLPSFPDLCPTYNGEHGAEWEERVRAQYAMGATPKTIHEMNPKMPCNHGDNECPYEARWDFDADNYDVIIGHYSHANLPIVTAGRSIIFDEDVGNTFKTRLEGSTLVESVNTFLSQDVSPPVDDFDELLQIRNARDRRAECERWFNQMIQQDEIDLGVGDGEGVISNTSGFSDPAYHAFTPHAVYAILTGSPISQGSDFERASIGRGRMEALFFTTSDEHGSYYVEIKEPPELEYASSVLCLDGTPVVDDNRPPGHKCVEWINSLGRQLEHVRIMSDSERQQYIRGELGHQYVRTTDAVKPYSSGRYNNATEDAVLIRSARQLYGDGHTGPTVFTTKNVREQYEELGFDGEGMAEDIDHFGNLRGSDRYGDRRLGLILGSTHHGDHEIRRRAAWLRKEVEPSGRGIDREYGSDIGNSLLASMRENVVFQSAMRLGRDGEGATTVLHTAAIPDSLPVTGVGSVSPWSEGEREVFDAWKDLSPSGVSFVEVDDVASHPSVSISRRQIRNILSRFADAGYISKGDHPTDGRKTAYVDDGLLDVEEHEQGEVELPEVDPDVGEVPDVPETLRLNIYTSDFRFSPVLGSSGERSPAADEGQSTFGDDPGGSQTGGPS